jgi:hypothetical protein
MDYINFSNISSEIPYNPASNCEVIAEDIIREYSQAIDSTIVKFCVGIVFCWVIYNVYGPFLKNYLSNKFQDHSFTINWIFNRIINISSMIGDFMLLFILGIAYYKNQLSPELIIFCIANLILIAIIQIYVTIKDLRCKK